jgi:nicotinic acid mononucleotide adenylyltransferase
LCTTVRYLSVPIQNKSCMFGENKSMVDISKQVSAKLHKSYSLLSLYHVKEYNASTMVRFYFIFGESNKSDVLREAWGYSQICTRLQALLFWTGDTIDISE